MTKPFDFDVQKYQCFDLSLFSVLYDKEIGGLPFLVDISRDLVLFFVSDFYIDGRYLWVKEA